MKLSSAISMFAIASLVAGSGSLSCKKPIDNDSEGEQPRTKKSSTKKSAAEYPYIEKHDNGSIHWDIDENGVTHAIVKTPSGDIAEDAKGTVTFKTANGDVKANLEKDPDTGVLIAKGPKLADDITEVRYNVSVAGKPLAGAMHVPQEGTSALVAEAEVAAKVEIPAGKKGPNGGVIQVVGDDVVEIVADKGSGETRVYLLDADFKVVPVGDRKVTLGFVGATPEVIVTTVGPGGAYFVAKAKTKINPIKVTVAVRVKNRARVVLVGYRPHTVVVVGVGAPVVAVFVPTPWVVVGPTVVVGGPVIYWGHGHGWGHGWGHSWGH
jgi:hypothetical protein